MAATRLTALPTELLTKVLEVLLVREICGLRIVSRGLEDDIDSNEDALARRTIESNRARLIARRHWLLDLQSVNVVDVLARYSSYYGDIEVSSPGYSGIVIDPMLTETLKHKVADLRLKEKLALHHDVHIFFHAFKYCHDGMHKLMSDKEDMIHFQQRVWNMLESSALRLTGDPVSDIEYLLARLQDSTALQGPHYTTTHGVPRFPITDRIGLHYPRCSKGSQVCDNLLVETTLGLPPPLMTLGYHLKTEKMQKMVHAACNSSEPIKNRLFQSAFRLAALMEETFFF
ncbi:hypothetical protein B0A48_08543 [Cryoendolithus antarcticus]|uniref:F-box domain-containing protein n=1 Tax=Cryoendolithus antarcticus TaxID=1507870 RepID=A0A1V8T5R7_9PEZI|nr:hypothetical protein B0A48_08543 [Cryoendolithus antarcticus]